MTVEEALTLKGLIEDAIKNGLISKETGQPNFITYLAPAREHLRAIAWLSLSGHIVVAVLFFGLLLFAGACYVKVRMNVRNIKWIPGGRTIIELSYA